VVRVDFAGENETGIMCHVRIEVQLAITDYNNRPAHALNGLTPLEALSNQQPNLQIRTQMIQEAAKQRIQYNKTDNCCYTNK
jgi:hypothetical protein